MLNLLVADEYVLYATTRDFQWNVTGPMSHRLQEQFEWQAEHIAGWIDDLAERARAIGIGVRGNLAGLPTATRLGSEPGIDLPAPYMLARLIALHEELMIQLHADSEVCLEQFMDVLTSEVLTGILAQHTNAAGTLRSLLEGAAEDASQEDPPLRSQNSN